MIRQKRFGTEVTYDFKSEHIDYKVKDSSGLRTFSVSYEEISGETQEMEEKNVWWRNVGWLWIAVGAFQVFQVIESGAFRLPFWLVLGMACLAVYHFRVRRYTVIPSGMANLLIIKNKDHDALIARIQEERRRYFRDRYFRIDDNSDKDTELNKFVWLRENNIITQEEFDKANIELLIR